MQEATSFPRREKSAELFARAKAVFPGGVSSPVRAFKSVSGPPLFIKRGDGCYVWDEDDNRYIDFCASWGPLILGHNNEQIRERIFEAVASGTSFGTPTLNELELGELLVKNNPYLEKVRFVSSGTEAVMSAIRLARGFTGRSKILKFEGCYHGHLDSLLVKAGSGLVTFGESTSAGIPPSFAAETLVIPLDDRAALDEALDKYGQEIACIIIEPIPANNGLLLQDYSFLKYLRQKATEHKVLLLFDEVISGFRVHFAGAAGYYDIKPDLVTYGKIIGGGMPVGAYGGSNELMAFISPDGPVYQAGTLSGNPVAMAAGLAACQQLLMPNFYCDLDHKTNHLIKKLTDHATENKYSVTFPKVGSIFWIAFSTETIKKADQIDPASMKFFKLLHAALLEKGVYMGPSGYEVGFVSSAHTIEVLDEAAEIINWAMDSVFSDL
ncbi:MAG: glutamate-1-semialdehyde 2,1-aminomutase [Saprospiraceae bacterium]|nr:glutamate-1-semialdehyde 2,1-aminomutase [Saprospiraceae bacterium]MDP4913770.1 glutamate-1-semialdehyde 2,1-aminomutase [Saprospiraceae bacterium]MDP5049887.1 glutamate-1-semialdehyde 2,1-aminomutase [Saprospiraceae bacterium]